MTRESEENWPKRGRGRPKKNDTYEHVVKVRLNDEQWYLLQECVIETNMSQSDVMREALETYHNIKLKWR